MADRLATFAAAALCVAAAFQATSFAWHSLRPRDPGCAVYEDTAGRTARVALSGGEAVDAMFEIMATTHDAQVEAGLHDLLEATASGDHAAAAAAQERVMGACGLTGEVRGYADFGPQLADHLG
ncbi:MAG TPA: hypothetical protein VII47_11575 [Actinomycetota bacterium]|jgi:hypothetical protein